MKKFSRGTTFIELLIVMGIIAIFSGFLLLNYRIGERQSTLQMAAIKLAQNVRRAQEFSASTKDFNGTPPIGGYGLYFTTIPSDTDPPDKVRNHYILFADTNGDSIYNQPGNPVSDGIVEDIQLGPEVQIYSITVPASSSGNSSTGGWAYSIGQLPSYSFSSPIISSGASATITFIPPVPTVKINSPFDLTSIQIILALTADPTKTKKITINKLGLVYIEKQ